MSDNRPYKQSDLNPLLIPACGQKVIYCKRNPAENPNEPLLEMIVECGKSVKPVIDGLRRKGNYVAGYDF